MGARRRSARLAEMRGRRRIPITTTEQAIAEYVGDLERTKIITWRIDQLERADFTETQAVAIATADADWRKAIELVRDGCDHDTAVGIVL